MRVEDIEGLAGLWEETTGHPEIRIAVLDGPVDLEHECFRATAASTLALTIGASEEAERARLHGTHIASLIFGSHESAVRGVAPQCSALLGRIHDDERTHAAVCTPDILAFAINKALDVGAHVINISSGVLVDDSGMSAVLETSLRRCEERRALVVAAAGNDGCRCDHLPALFKSVLAVGAIDAAGAPARFSNWGAETSSHGLLAPGVNLVGAGPDGGVREATGTSQATAIVSGVSALLMHLQWRRHGRIDGPAVREVLLRSAQPCAGTFGDESARCMAGRLNIAAAMDDLVKGRRVMSLASVPETSASPELPQQDLAVADAARELKPSAASSQGVNDAAVRSSTPQALRLSDCGCGGAPGACTCGTTPAVASKPQYVFPIGRIGYDYPNKTGRDSLRIPERLPNPDDRKTLIQILKERDQEERAEELIWTLEVDGEPLYAIAPLGAYAVETYKRLIEFLSDQEIGIPPVTPEGGERPRRRQARAESGDTSSAAAGELTKVEYCAIPGTIVGRAHLYLAGKDVDVIRPSLRGMANWNLHPLIEAAEAHYRTLDQDARPAQPPGRGDVLNFLRILFSELRNEGRAPEDRAKNFIAISFLEMLKIFGEELAKKMALESIDVRPSQVRPAGTDRWDVVLSFFKPTDQLGTAVTEYPLTVDVDYVNPTIVSSGPPRQRSMRVVKPYR